MKCLVPCFLLVTLLTVQESNAQWGVGGFGYAPYYNRGIYVDQDRIPYFTLHPPVYYSYPVPRPYGFSPFAYPGTTRTPEFKVQEPAVLLNPYVSPETQPRTELPLPKDAPQLKSKKPSIPARPSADRLGTVAPLRISNPFAGGVQQASLER